MQNKSEIRKKDSTANRLEKRVVVARVAAMESEAIYLRTVYGCINRQAKDIEDRIESIKRQIAAERESVNE
ncbi:MAG: hypothetical protein WC437_05495 [Patescibacteria group bacterium]|jgi:hypothetical protein